MSGIPNPLNINDKNRQLNPATEEKQDNIIDQQSNDKQTTQLVDHSGFQNSIGIFGEQLAVDLHNDIIVNFQYNISSRDVKTSTSNGGSVSQSESMAVISSGTNAAGSALVQSINAIRYRSGHTAIAQFTILFQNGGVVGRKQMIGPFDSEDGYYIGYKDTDLIVGYRNGGVDIEAISSSFNGDAILSEYDWTKVNVCRVRFGWLGAAPIIFEIMRPGTTKWVTLHTFKLHGTIIKPHIGNPAIPIRMEVVGTSGSTNVVMKTGSWQGGIYGMSQERGSRPFGFTTTKILAADTTEQAVLTFKSADTFQGKTNKVRSNLLRYILHVDPPATGSGTITWRFRKGATLGGTPTYVDIDSNNSVLSTDTAQTYVSGGTSRVTEFVSYHSQGNAQGAGGQLIDAELLRLFIDPGEVTTLTAQNSNGVAVTVRVSYNWIELF